MGSQFVHPPVQLSTSLHTHCLVCILQCPVTCTRNGTVAPIVAKAAAKHLMPLMLKQSPAIVDLNTMDLKIATKHILWGKILNAGQVSG